MSNKIIPLTDTECTSIAACLTNLRCRLEQAKELLGGVTRAKRRTYTLAKARVSEYKNQNFLRANNNHGIV